MKFKLQIFAYAYTTFQLTVCLYEIIHMYSVSFPPYYTNNLNLKLCLKYGFASVKSRIFDIIKNYFIIFLISTKLENYDQDQENDKQQTHIIQEFKNIIVENKLLIATYLSFSFKIGFKYLKFEVVFLPALFFIMQLFLYSKIKYFSGILRMLLEIIYDICFEYFFSENKFYENIFSINKNLRLEIFSKKILEELNKNNFEICHVNYSSNKPNFSITLYEKKVLIRTFGKFVGFLTTSEMHSFFDAELLYIIKYEAKKKFLSYGINLIMIIAENILIYNENYLFENNGCLQENCIRIYIFLKLTLGIFLEFLLACYKRKIEFECAKYSFLNNGKADLIKALIKIYKSNNLMPIRSYMYDILYLTCPSLDRKIKYIENLKFK